MKPGFTTSEFWVAVATNVIGVVLSLASMFGHVIDPSSINALVPALAVVASAVASAVYSHSRANVKAALAANSVAPVRPAPPTVVPVSATPQ